MDGDNLATPRRRIIDAFILFVGEKNLPQLDPVADLDGHRRLHANVIVADQRHGSAGYIVLDGLQRLTRYGHIQPLRRAYARYHGKPSLGLQNDCLGWSRLVKFFTNSADEYKVNYHSNLWLWAKAGATKK